MKSSTSSISQPEVIRYLKELKTDYPAAAKYRIRLVGERHRKDLKKQLDKKMEKDQLLQNVILSQFHNPEKMEITFDEMGFQAQQERVLALLYKTISKLRGKALYYQTMDILANATLFLFTRLATDGGKLSRRGLEERILSWADNVLSEDPFQWNFLPGSIIGNYAWNILLEIVEEES